MGGALRLRLVVFCVVAISFALSFTALALRPWRPDPAQDLTALRERVEAAGSYRLRVEIDQLLLPRATPAMIGEQEQRVTLSGEGAVALPDRSTLQLRRLDQSGAPPLTLVNAAGRSFVQQGDKLVAPSDQPAAAAPSLGLLAYLDAAADVKVAPANQPGGAPLLRYSFRVDGERLVRQLAAPYGLALPGKAPIGQRLSGIGGRGELWVDATGLPVRQLLELDMPAPGANYDVQARIDASFFDFGRVERLLQPAQGNDGVWRAEPYELPPGGSTQPWLWRDLLPSAELLVRGAQALLLVAFGLGLALLWLVLRRLRHAYLLATLPICALLVVQPVLLPGDVGGVRAKVVEAAERQKTEELAAQALQQAREELQQAGGQLITGGGLPPAACGQGAPNADTDDDGLSDLAENCIGTDYDNADSDGDLVGDGDEAKGFSYAGQTWTSDPLKGDSNADGIADTNEWPLPMGLGVVTDTNTNNVPDLWDLDNDGDGVEDSLDLAPQQFTGYRPDYTLRLSSGSALEGATYVDVQLRPQDAAQLRYSLSTLDWPLDSKGQITDLDNSPGDLRLVPMLEITTTVAPALAGKYGAVVQRVANGLVEKLLLPLSPVEQYGKVSAFSARMAYLNDEARDLSWDMRLVWVVQAQIDSYIKCAAQSATSSATTSGGKNCGISTVTSPIQTYAGGPFRLTGLDISRSRAVDTAIFGVPRPATEGETMLSLLGGLSETYLLADTIENQAANRRILPEFAVRFNNPNTPLEQKFFITDTVVVAQRSYAHSDEATSSLSGAALPDFLDANGYAAAPAAQQCPQDDGSRLPCAMLAIAIEQDNASAGLPTSGGTEVNGGSFSYRLDSDDFVFSTLRSLKLSLYTRSGGAWQALALPDALVSINQRYDFEALASQAQPELPGVTAGTLRTLTFAFYLSWLNGTIQTTRVGEDSQLYQVAPTNFVPLQPTVSAGLYKLPILIGTAAKAAQITEAIGLNLRKDLKGQTFAVDDAAKSNRLLAQIKQQRLKFLGLSSVLALRFLIGVGTLLSLSVGIANVICPQAKACDSATLRGATVTVNIVLNSMSVVSSGYSIIGLLTKELNKTKSATGAAAVYSSNAATNRYARSPSASSPPRSGATSGSGAADLPAQKIAKPSKGLLGKLLDKAENLRKIAIRGDTLEFRFTTTGVGSKLPKILKGLTKVGKALGPIGLVVELGLIWGFFGASSTSLPGFAFKAALANAIVASIFAIMLFALSFVPGGNIISAILGLIDSIIQAATGGEWSISRVLTELFYSVKLASEFSNLEFVGKEQSGLADPALGVVVGNRFSYRDIFRLSFVISDTRVADRATGRGSFTAIAPAGVTTSVDNALEQCTTPDERSKICENSAKAEFDLAQPQRNVDLGVKWRADYTYAYYECAFFGSWCPTTTTEAGNVAKDDQVLSFTLDVLPATVGGFVNWSELSSNDRDGDGIPNAEESALGTSPTNWDSDGDGLSDGYERGRGESTSAGLSSARPDPLKADSDGDGLSDAEELRFGTNPIRTDSDGDGLSDAEELVHLANGGLAGGWTLRFPGAPLALLGSDPVQRDYDGDGLSDLAERAGVSSAFARNDGPFLGLDITPRQRTPDGLFGSFVRPGDPVSLDLALISGGLPVTSSLELCLPAQLGELSARALTRTSAAGSQNDVAAEASTQPSCGAGYRWRLDRAQQLLLGELVTTTLTARLDGALNSSQTLPITASVRYGDRVISETRSLVVDGDLPSVAWSAPEDGAFLRGQRYILGGTASDATSGLNQVEIKLPGSSEFGPAEELSPWALGWTLPADGVYTLEARAVDVALADNSFVPVGGATDAITLTGSAGDNLAGVARVQLSIDGRPWQELSLPAAGETTTAWSYVWPVDTSAQGTHRLTLRAYDRAGNLSAVVARTLIVDTVAPANELTTRRYQQTTPPVVQAGTPLTLTGYVNDAGNAPLPLRPRSDLIGGVSTVATATIWLEFPRAADSLSSTATWLGDVDGDGLGDLAVGMPNASGGAGRVTIVYGRGGDWSVAPLANPLANSPTSFVGLSGARLGAQVAPAGDLNGDGLYDMLIGDPAANRVFVVWGRVAPLGRDTPLDGDYLTGWAILDAPAGLRIGALQSAAGDVNGDGFDDLLVGATPAGGGTGQLFLVAGQGAGRWPVRLALPDAATAIYPLPAGARARGLGDLDGDQIDDWALADGAAGQLSLFLGDAGLARGLDQPPLARTIESRAAGFALPPGAGKADIAALADVNGDALADFVYRGAGDVPRLVLGRAGGAWGDSFVFDGYTPALDGFVAAPGDLNADGLNDILLGGTEGGQPNAYLFYGARSLPARPGLVATFSGVAAAASAPYAAGSDLNCDASSDLLLVPLETTTDGRLPVGLSYGALPQVDPDALPQARANGAPAGATAAAVAARLTPPDLPADAAPVSNWLYVDDDYCASCANDGFGWETTAFSSIQSAVNAATSNTQIVVRPGLYTPFQVQGTATLTGNLWISGVNPDAVFVDGAGSGDGVTLSDVKALGLSGLTIRNTQRGIVLTRAGVGGYAAPADKIAIERLLIHSFAQNGIAMDRASSVSVGRSTISGGASSSSYLFVDPTTPDPALAPGWAQRSNLPEATTARTRLAALGSDLYALLGGENRSLLRASPGTGNVTFTSVISLPFNPGTNGALADGGDGALYAVNQTPWANATVAAPVACTYKGLACEAANRAPLNSALVVASAIDRKGNVYVGGNFTGLNGQPAGHVARWDVQLEQWQALGAGAGALSGPVTTIALDSKDRLYVGGYFTQTVGGNALNYVATWQNGTWQPLVPGIGTSGPGVTGPVLSLKASASDSILVGGAFNDPNYYDPPGHAGLTDSSATYNVNPNVLGTCDPDAYQVAVYPYRNYNDPAIPSVDGTVTAADSWCQVLDENPGVVYDFAADPSLDVPVNDVESLRVGGFVQAALYSGDTLLQLVTADTPQLPAGVANQVTRMTVTLKPLNQGNEFVQRIARWFPPIQGGTTGVWRGLGAGMRGTDDRAVVSQIAEAGGEIFAGGILPPIDPPIVDGERVSPVQINLCAARDGIAIYEQVDYNRADKSLYPANSPLGQGANLRCLILQPGAYADLAAANLNFDNLVSSVQVGGNFEVLLYPEPNFGGAVVRLTKDDRNLATNGIDNLVSSLIVQRKRTNQANIRRWNGLSWQALGAGTTGPVFGLALGPDGSLYASSWFITPAGTADPTLDIGRGISRWRNGWEDLTYDFATGMPGLLSSTSLAVMPDGAVYLGSDSALKRLDPGRTQWATVKAAPNPTGGSFNTLIYDPLHTLQGELVVASGPEVTLVDTFAAQAKPLYKVFRYTPATGWSSRPLLGNLAGSFALAGDGAGGLFVLVNGATPALYRYNLAFNPFNQVTSLANLPVAAGAGTTISWANGALYALVGGTRILYRWNANNTWTRLADLPLPGATIIAAGAGLAWDGGDYLYAAQGGGGVAFLRYSISANAWQPLPDLGKPALPAGFTVGTGSALTRVGAELFTFAGNGQPQVYRYGPVGAAPVKLLLNETAFVAPASLAAPAWLNASLGTPDDFQINAAATNRWVGGAGAVWTPAVPAGATLTVGAARFVNVDRNLYRLQQGSTLTAGYSRPAPDAVVAPDFGPAAPNDGLVWGQTAFSSIQDAIDAGALRVTLRPGRYQEPFSLVSGVEIVGAGAENTLLTLPLGSTAGAIIDAGGVQGARVSGVTIAGNGPDGPDGLRAAGAQLRLARSIVRDAAAGVRLRGLSAQVELVNLTIAGNKVGVEAQGAPLDLRNSLLAFQSTAALSYTSGPTVLYPFNAFWQNAANYRVDGANQEVPQAGVVVVDPRLSAPEDKDFRPLAGSSLLGAGSPSDPMPPGTGGRVDIGYFQQGRAALYVDDDYCDPRNAPVGASCENDGLEWGVDAFDRIQPALDAARLALQRLDCSKEQSIVGVCSMLTVGAAPGSYTEPITLASRVVLVGSGADQTILTTLGTGPVVAISGSFQAALRGFSIVGGSGVRIDGPTRNVGLERLIIRGGSGGVQVSGGGAVQIAFTTFAGIGGPAVLVDGARGLAELSSSIVAGGPTALQARNGGRISSNYNLLNATANYDDGNPALPVAQHGAIDRGNDDLLAVDPRFVGPATNDYRLQVASPAVDSADPFAAALAGGGERTDRGYAEVEAIPLALLPGKEGLSCQVGNSGAQAVELAAVLVPDATQPATATLPADNAWQSVFASEARPVAAYWAGVLTPAADGLYRLYSRARDAAGNSTDASFLGHVGADGTAPTVGWVAQPPASVNDSAVAVSAEASDYLNLGGSWQFNVTQVAFEVISGTQVQTYSADWDDAGWDVAARTPRRFKASIPLPLGTVQVRAVARDQAGNSGATPAIAVQGTSINGASFIEPVSGAATAAFSLTVSGSANFASDPAVPLVVVTRSGNGQPTATFTPTLATPGQVSSSWAGLVALPADGVYTLSAQAARGGPLGAATIITMTRDTVSPTLAIAPVPGVVGAFAALTGTAGDALSGVAGVEISVDGGTTWDAATIAGGSWSYAWTTPVDLDGQAIVVQARSHDRAGNTAVVSASVVVDSVAPALPEGISFSLPERSYFDLDLNEQLAITWLTPTVGTSIRLLVDSAPTTTLTAASGQLVAGRSTSVGFPDSGSFYVHLAAVDAAGNVTIRHTGPWFAGSAADLQIQIDGRVDRERKEWLPAMRLDDDERPQPQRAAQELYWAADDAGAYIGWQGAQWTLDGALVAYFGLGEVGAIVPLVGTTTPTLTLPFAARYAVLVNAAGGTLYEASGGGWTPSTRPWRWAHDPGNGGGTEIALPFLRRGAVELRLLALTTAGGRAWSLFPTPNLLDGPLTASYQLTAQALAQSPSLGRGSGLLSLAAAPLAQRGGGFGPQPRMRSLRLSAIATPPLVAASGTITYLLTMTSDEANDTITPLLQLTGAGGLRYAALAGATCGGGCPAAGTVWSILVPNLAPGATRLLTVTAQAPATTELTSVTSTLALSVEGSIAGYGTAAVQLATVIDGAAPETSMVDAITPTIAPGAQILSGVASDGLGSGVARVELRLPGSDAWQVVSGTTDWIFDVVVPANATSYPVETRAVDRFGAISAPTTTIFTVDTISPTAQLALPSVVSGTTALIGGTAQDPFPLGGDIALVEVQVGAEDAPWDLVSAFVTTTVGVDWRYAWPLPTLDGVAQRMRVRSTDAAGNLSLPTAWQTTTVDTVAPLITATKVFSSVTLSNSLTETVQALLEGEVTDGGPVMLIAELLDPAGALRPLPVERDGSGWAVRPARASDIPTGSYRLQVEARDQAGNIALLPPVDIEILVAPQQNLRIHLPLILTPPPLPDLVVERITATEAGIEVVMRNQGGAPVTAAFWVELYLNPTVEPTRVNQIWPDLAAQGAVWGVTRDALPLEPGGTLTLRQRGAYFRQELSELPAALAAGTRIVVQLDSASTLTSYGAVLEAHEARGEPYNNILSLVVDRGIPLPSSKSVAPGRAGEQPLPRRPADP